MKLGIHNKNMGKCGEDAACKFLKEKGMKIIKRNFRGKFGEIDIIASDGESLIFAEVKSRSSKRYGTASEAVTYNKRSNIVRTAKEYLIKNPTDMGIRFDVLEVYATFADGIFLLDSINHIENAFWEE